MPRQATLRACSPLVHWRPARLHDSWFNNVALCTRSSSASCRRFVSESTSVKAPQPTSSSSLPSSSDLPDVVGSAPQLSRYLILQTPHDAQTWPSHIESTSRLYQSLGRKQDLLPWSSSSSNKSGGGEGDEGTSQSIPLPWGFTFSDGGQAKQGQHIETWDKTKSRFDNQISTNELETLGGWIYPDFIKLDQISPDTLDEVKSDLANKLQSTTSTSSATTISSDAAPPKRVHIFVCTHGSRDCRCGDLGEPLFQALVRDVERRKLGGLLTQDGPQDGVRVARVAHIGGHRLAGNALVFRDDGKCDWYGLLRASDATELVDHALSAEGKPWWQKWRGRLGMTSEQIKHAYVLGVSGESTAQQRKQPARKPLGEAVRLTFETFEGDVLEVIGYERESVMETAKRHDLPSIEATCGGFCECATCHVIVPSSAGEAPLPEMKDEEDEQLEFAIGATDDSRLSCQLPVTKLLGQWCAAGGVIKLPRY
ncbi:hypothetical protein OIO90_003496 [Microbotryomycetes sp. JL221]|nr:hypothetical protein OIO90_003496 [Microbotryomycetes sp. JL221]